MMVKALNKSTIAKKYNWTLNFFVHKINDSTLLLNALEMAGYNKNQRIFTQRQLDIIYDHLGNPE